MTPEPNEEHIRRTFARIVIEHEKHPERFNMETWGRHHRACGTTACLAGWSAIERKCTMMDGGHLVHKEDAVQDLYGRWHPSAGAEVEDPNPIFLRELEVEALGLQDDALFYTHQWPEDYETQYKKGDKLAALAGAIEHFTDVDVYDLLPTNNPVSGAEDLLCQRPALTVTETPD